MLQVASGKLQVLGNCLYLWLATWNLKLCFSDNAFSDKVSLFVVFVIFVDMTSPF